MRSILSALAIGDTARVEVRRSGAPFLVSVPITGYDVPHVVLEEVRGANEKQQRLRAAWRASR
jgi:hypothetical protein